MVRGFLFWYTTLRMPFKKPQVATPKRNAVRSRGKAGKPDLTLLILLAVIVVFGLVILTSASSLLGQKNFHDSYYYLKHQLLYGIFLGLIAFYVMSKIDYHYWRKY